jgi:hypothetical protein
MVAKAATGIDPAGHPFRILAYPHPQNFSRDTFGKIFLLLRKTGKPDF